MHVTDHARQATGRRSRLHAGPRDRSTPRHTGCGIQLALLLAACCLNGIWPDARQLVAQDADPAAVAAPPTATDESSLTWAQTPQTPLRSQLKHLTWQQLIGAMQSVIPERLSLVQADDGSSDLLVSLPARTGRTDLRLNPQSGALQLRGELAPAWLRVIEWLDKPASDASETTQLAPIGQVDPQSISRTVSLLRLAESGRLREAARWGGDLLGIQSTTAPAETPAANDTATEAANDAAAPESPQGFSETPASDALAQAEPPAPAAPALPPDAGAAPSEAAGAGETASEGTLMGPVQVEFVEGLDAIIVRGRKPDVDRVLKIIEDLEKLSGETEPAIEMVMLQHVNSQSMTDLVNELNTAALAARRGTVSVTALIKPNAILLIGRPESVESTVELIRRLDQPVAPASQFKVFRLKHMPSSDAQQTITTFFEERGGLGPSIQVQADVRTNSLIVYASPRDMAEVGYLIEKIDVGEGEAVDEVRVFKLKNALAEELAPVLQATLRGEATTGQVGQPGQAQPGTSAQSSTRSSMLTLTRIDGVGGGGPQTLRSGILTDVRVAADSRANSLVVTAPADSMGLIAALVKQLDELPTSEAQIKVFTITNGDAASLGEMLNELFGQAANQQQNQPFASAIGAGESSLVPLRFSVDMRTNSIIATGSAADLDVVEAILLRLDESDIRQRKNRVYRLLNAPAQDVAAAINELLLSQRQIDQLAPEAVSPFTQIEREVIVVPEIVSNSLLISATPRVFRRDRGTGEGTGRAPAHGADPGTDRRGRPGEHGRTGRGTGTPGLAAVRSQRCHHRRQHGGQSA